MSCRIGAVEHRKCAAGLAGAHLGLQDRILQNCTRIEHVHEVRKKTFNLSYVAQGSATFFALRTGLKLKFFAD